MKNNLMLFGLLMLPFLGSAQSLTIPASGLVENVSKNLSNGIWTVEGGVNHVEVECGSTQQREMIPAEDLVLDFTSGTYGDYQTAVRDGDAKNKPIKGWKVISGSKLSIYDIDTGAETTWTVTQSRADRVVLYRLTGAHPQYPNCTVLEQQVWMKVK